MSDNKLSDFVKTALDGIKNFTDMETVTGNAILTPNGVTVIPVSKISVAFASGGLEYAAKKFTGIQNFGSGGGTGVTITPVAFLTVSPDASVNLIPITEGGSSLDKAASIIENAPKIIEKIKDRLT